MQAEKAVERAGAELLDNLQHDKSVAAIETDFDRLEAAAFEVKRRALAAFDAPKRCRDAAKFAGEIERLSGKARSWLEYVRLSPLQHPDAVLPDELPEQPSAPAATVAARHLHGDRLLDRLGLSLAVRLSWVFNGRPPTHDLILALPHGPVIVEPSTLR